MTEGDLALKWWDHLRALLIAAHVAVIVFMALPSPEGGMNKKAWKDPTVQAEFDAWHTRFVALGWDVERDAMEEQLWTFAQSYAAGRDGILDPLDPYFRHLGTRQSWRMFVAPYRNPAKLVIAVQTGGTWEVVYRARDPEARWLATQLDHTRTRSATFRYAWPHYRSAYGRFVEWVATQAVEDFPEATALRAYWWRYRTPSPRVARTGAEPDGKVERSRVVDLTALRTELAEASP